MQTENSTNVQFGKRLAERMLSLGLNNTELGRSCEISPTAVANYLEGRLPKADQFHRIARRLGVTMEWLIAGGSGAVQPARSLAESNKIIELESKLEAVRRLLESALNKL